MGRRRGLRAMDSYIAALILVALSLMLTKVVVATMTSYISTNAVEPGAAEVIDYHVDRVSSNAVTISISAYNPSNQKCIVMYGYDVDYYPNGIEAGSPEVPSLMSPVIMHLAPGETDSATTTITFSDDLNEGVLEVHVAVICETTSYDDYLLVPIR